MIEVPAGSTETIPVPVRHEDPVTGESVLSAYSVEVALPVDGVAPSSWTATTWKSGTKVEGGDRYYLVNLLVGTGGFTLTAGNTYRCWVRIDNKVLVKTDTIKAINT